MDRAYATLQIKSVQDDQRVIEGIASTPTPDRDGDVMEPAGAKFALPLPLLWQHNRDQPIGHVIAASVTKAGIVIKAKLAPAGVLPKIDEAWSLLKSGLVRGLSVGFRPLDTPERIAGTSGFRVKSWEWVELSAVTIPANAATTIHNIKSYDRAAGHPAPKLVAVNLPVGSGSALNRTMKSISEQLTAANTALRTKSAELDALHAIDVPDAPQLEQRASLVAEVKALTEDIDRLEVMERAQAKMARPLGVITGAQAATIARQPDPQYQHIQVTDPTEKGIGFARLALCKMAAHLSGESPLTVARARWPHYDRLHKELTYSLKGAVDPGLAGGATSPSWGGELSNPETLASEFIEYLRPTTIIGKFGVGNVPNLRRIPFNVRITGQSGGGTGYWVGEAKQKPVTSFGFLETFHYWYKAAAITVISDELARFSTPSAEALVREALAGAIRERIDTDFIDPDKAAATGNNASPASILRGVTPLAASGTDADSVSNDVARLAQTFIDGNIDLGSNVLIMPVGVALKLSLMKNAQGVRSFPDISMNGGTLEGFPVITSQYAALIGSPNQSIMAMVSANDIYLSDDGQVTVDVSREASIEMSNTPETESGTVVSMYQTNQMALRAERFINWSKRRTLAAAFVGNVLYTPLVA